MTRGVALVAGGLVSGVGLLGAAPYALQHLDFFQVRQVELVGLRYLTPEAVLETLALPERHNLFNGSEELERCGAAIPGVATLRLERRLPGTLRISLRERVPVAFVPTAGGLVPLEADAKPLPYDPSASGLDLPLVPQPDSLLTRTLAVVRAADSALFAVVSGARRGRRGAVIVELGEAEVLLRAVPAADEIRAVAAVRRHLLRNGHPFARMDARFADWVVVRRERV